MRPSKDEYFMEIAKVVATRSECARRSVGCVIVDKRGRLLSTGTNGVAPGRVACTDVPCPGANLPTGEGLDICRSSHSEISALVTLGKPFEAHTLYCTTEPCISCTKAILLTSIERVVYLIPYVNRSGRHLWGNDSTWIQHKPEASRSL